MSSERLPYGFEPDSLVYQMAYSALDFLQRRHQHRVIGLEHLPREGPTLLVINHSLATYDAVMLGKAIYDELGRVPRGLGDRKLFRYPGLTQLAQFVGTVEASPNAGLDLLREGYIALVAPGGMLEALRPSEDRYQLSWETRKGFVRLALAAGCPVVLAACPTADDLYTVYPSEITRLVYETFRFPLPMFRGTGFGRLLPRAIRLTHLLSEPITPPAIAEDDPAWEDTVDRFHRELMERMTRLMEEALIITRQREDEASGQP